MTPLRFIYLSRYLKVFAPGANRDSANRSETSRNRRPVAVLFSPNVRFGVIRESTNLSPEKGSFGSWSTVGRFFAIRGKSISTLMAQRTGESSAQSKISTEKKAWSSTNVTFRSRETEPPALIIRNSISFEQNSLGSFKVNQIVFPACFATNISFFHGK